MGILNKDKEENEILCSALENKAFASSSTRSDDSIASIKTIRPSEITPDYKIWLDPLSVPILMAG